MSSPAFVHLRVHTEYSLVDSVVRIKSLMRSVADDGMPAVALADQGNLFAMVKFYKSALATGIKPIIGVDAWVRPLHESEHPFRLVLLCQDRTGYLNLSQLVSRAYLEGQRAGSPVLEIDWIRNHSDGLIALSGGREGDIGRALLVGNQQLAEELLFAWKEIFPDRYYLELQRTGREHEEEYLHAAVDLASSSDTPVVATNHVVFLKPDDFESHEVRVCIHEGRTLDDPRRPKHYSRQQYLRTQTEMQELFSDIPEALENSVEIARRCNLQIELGQSYLPQFPIPKGETTESYFTRIAEEGLAERLDVLLDKKADDYTERKKEYEQRLQIEIDVIIGMGFPGYFLIVADFIRWSRENDVPVGPGRGSGAGSLVAYSMRITDIDPLKFELLFERFLNPERVSLPDFDIDFCMEGRDRVIEYVAQKYGRDRVSQIITYGSLAAKAVVRDVGRVMGQPYGFVDRIAKQVPFEIGMTLTRALKESDDLKSAYDSEEEVRDIIDMALSLEGLSRNAGKHAGGVVISPTTLTEFTPLYCEEGGQGIVTQLDKDDVESIGLVKFDFLGLRTLTIIDWAVKNINRKRQADAEETLDISSLTLDDKATFALLKKARTTAVFQLESRGMKQLIERLQPDSFEDVIALVALYRPGPLQSGMVDDFIARKHGAAVEYPHPELEHILQQTYGIILYQEQVMQIAQILAGYTLGDADILRRAMGKKKPEEMARQREIFLSGATGRGVDKRKANYIFDLMEKFAGYGFNKSHSAAYAMLSYQTAWLKTHYPSEFMASVLSSDMDNTDKVVALIEECNHMKLDVVPPDINQSVYHFSVSGGAAVLYGLGAIKGVGESALDSIISDRDANGEFPNLFDFCFRVDSRKVNKRVIEALIRAGAMDKLGKNRATLMTQSSDAMLMAEQQHRNNSVGQNDLFGESENPSSLPTDDINKYEVEDWSEELRLSAERETLGLYLTGHPIARYEEELSKITDCQLVNIADYAEAPSANGYRARNNAKEYKVAGLLMNTRIRRTKRGSKIITATLDDRTARVEVRLFEEVYEKYEHFLHNDRVLVVEGSIAYDDFNGGYRVTASTIYDMTQARDHYSKRLEIDLNGVALNGNSGSVIDQLTSVLQPFKNGGCPVWINYHSKGADTVLSLGDDWKVQPTDELLSRLCTLFKEKDVRVVY